MINKQAKVGQGVRSALELASMMKGTIGGSVGGSILGGKAGKALYNRKLRNLPLSKKAIHKIRHALSKNYRTDVDLTRKTWRDAGKEVGGTLGGYGGALYDFNRLMGRSAFRGSRSGRRGQYTRPGSGGFKDHLKTLGIPKNVKTKREAKKIFRENAFKHHPDRGGDPEKMKKINEAWKAVKESGWYEKLAHALRKQAAKKKKKLTLDPKKLKALLDKAKGSSKVNVNKLMGRNLPKSFLMGLAAFGGGAALSRLASKASQKIAIDSENK